MQTDEHSHLIKSTEQPRSKKSTLRGDVFKRGVTLDQKHCKDLIFERHLGDLGAQLLNQLCVCRPSGFSS